VWSIDAHRFPTKLLMAAGLVAGITLTGSLTGLICTVISLAVYVAMRTARGTTTSSLILAVAALAIVGGTVILMANSGLLPATLQVRFSEASVELTGRDITSLTSGRSDIQGQYLAFWRDQDIFRQLFGGYGVSVLALVGEPFSMIGLATHNTFLDVLFTCGLLGLLLFVVLILTSLRQAVTAFRSQADQVALSFFVAKVVWVLFAFSLSVFPSWTYLLLLLAV
jgi:O-antigen ligase